MIRRWTLRLVVTLALAAVAWCGGKATLALWPSSPVWAVLTALVFASYLVGRLDVCCANWVLGRIRRQREAAFDRYLRYGGAALSEYELLLLGWTQEQALELERATQQLDEELEYAFLYGTPPGAANGTE